MTVPTSKLRVKNQSDMGNTGIQNQKQHGEPTGPVFTLIIKMLNLAKYSKDFLFIVTKYILV
jgi:hypothetical protein